ncbi:redox-sensing transcriptional repressor rex [Candidatus Moduliflexus flocculans]|uniref:Redox-sensing transcriptional repressor Rex n=1 Tax=Candidatus Moduliflexus flocculans TaxID=1499966 RepID=A0A0S6W3R3_9BACT|nr:redox-sensing transcriptional repressor rex [Candidatus Moduliflexus flocculans]
MKTADNISEFTIYRLSIYKRCLEQLERENMKTVSSKEFASRFGLNSAQVRKDLAFFGEFGIRGMGYPIGTLKEQIMLILGLTDSVNGMKRWKTVVIGAGRLGAALLRSQDFLSAGFDLIAAFDKTPETSDYARQASSGLFESPVPVYPLKQLEETIQSASADMAILAVPVEEAQEMTNRLVNAGITAILNFVPIQLIVPSAVKVRTVDVVAELQCLAYHLHSEKLRLQAQLPKDAA